MAEPAIGIRAVFSSHTVGDNPHPTRVVIHATCPVIGYPHASAAGLAHSTAQYFAGGKAGGSAHYVEDIAAEEHCVPDTTIAYHAPPNEHSLGIEICADGGSGYPPTGPQPYTRAQWLAPDVWPAVARAAARTRELCDRFGIPTVRIGVAELLAGAHGICGHVDVSSAWHESSHSDPGPTFPWDQFMAAVTGAPAATVGAKKGQKTVDNTQLKGTGAIRFICPVGKASQFGLQAIVSAVVNGPNPGGVEVWFQDDNGGMADGYKTAPIPFAAGHSGRVGWKLPDGCTQVNVHYVFPDGGVIGLETG